MTTITDQLLDELDALAALSDKRAAGADEQGGLALPTKTVRDLTAMVRKLREEAQRHAEARATAEDALERTKAKFEAELTEMTTKRSEALEQTGRYAALAAHDDEQARATLERHGMSDLHFGCDTLDHVCEALGAARDSTRVLIAEALDLKAERNQARAERDGFLRSLGEEITASNDANEACCAACHERDAYKKAKAENDERFMSERDEARAQRDAAKRHGEECAQALEAAQERLKSMRARFETSSSAEENRLSAVCAQMREAGDRERASMQKRLDDLMPDAMQWRAAYVMLSEEMGARHEPALVCMRELLTSVKQLQSDKDHLLDAIDKDATGLAKALAAVMKVIEGRHWVTESRGAYEWNDQRYKMETYSAFQAILEIVGPALTASGTRANDAWRTFERGRIIKLATELGVLDGDVRTILESAHRFVTKGHHQACASVQQTNEARVSMEYIACDCGFNELRAFIKAQP